MFSTIKTYNRLLSQDVGQGSACHLSTVTRCNRLKEQTELSQDTILGQRGNYPNNPNVAYNANYAYPFGINVGSPHGFSLYFHNFLWYGM